MKRVYYSFDKWEDFKNGMFKTKCSMDENKIINNCKKLLKGDLFLWASMNHVSENWRYSAEMNLSNRNRNRQAWLGQSACCFAHNAPDYLTKEAWNLLSDNERKQANAIADGVIKQWEQIYIGKGFSWQK